jgi:hypothetical protein
MKRLLSAAARTFRRAAAACDLALDLLGDPAGVGEAPAEREVAGGVEAARMTPEAAAMVAPPAATAVVPPVEEPLEGSVEARRRKA